MNQPNKRGTDPERSPGSGNSHSQGRPRGPSEDGEPKAFRITDRVSSAEEIPSPPDQLALIEFDDVPLAEAMRLFSDQSGLNVITSTEAGKTKITVFLKNVSPLDALEAIVKANGLFYRIESNSGIVRIATLAEYEKDLSSFREEQTRVFTLLYPNPSAVAQVIQQVFGNRVQLNRADAETEDLVDLSSRFNRFDLVDGRSLGLGSPNNRLNNQAGRFGNNFSGQFQPFNMSGINGLGVPGALRNQPVPLSTDQGIVDSPQVLSADQIQKIENAVANGIELSEQAQDDLLKRKEATIYVSTIRRNNQVIVRTGDVKSMEQIAALVAQLDVPTPTVLLEVKVMRVILAEGCYSAFEFLGRPSNSAVAFSDGPQSPSFPGASTIGQHLGDGLGIAGNIPGALTFQVVDNNFRLRMQLLESRNCVNALATPLILTANNEVSRIFVGDTLPFTVGFTPSQVLSTVGAVNGAVAATPITEMRDVGQSLLITPNINADRTVTLRVVEENSERVVGGSSIPVPATSGSGVTNISVDTVRRRTISGTVVAQDGMAVALGGMIEEHTSNARDQIPVLGDIPGIGFLFRRQAAKQVRSELVVIIRPYVFNTPTESAATSETLLGELSTHAEGNCSLSHARCALPCAVTRSDAECSRRAKLFQFHSVTSDSP
ncbi:MAG: type II secretion system protein GspD [Pirellulaceae bacterium]|nr:type II secretion system protein GspD [Pirellulaceae bacterium]